MTKFLYWIMPVVSVLSRSLVSIVFLPTPRNVQSETHELRLENTVENSLSLYYGRYVENYECQLLTENNFNLIKIFDCTKSDFACFLYGIF